MTDKQFEAQQELIKTQFEILGKKIDKGDTTINRKLKEIGNTFNVIANDWEETIGDIQKFTLVLAGVKNAMEVLVESHNRQAKKVAEEVGKSIDRVQDDIVTPAMDEVQDLKETIGKKKWVPFKEKIRWFQFWKQGR